MLDYNREMIDRVPDPYHQVMFTATATLAVHELELHENDLLVDTDTNDIASATIVLPYVATCKNARYTIHARDVEALGTITIANRDDSEDWAGDYTLYEDGDQATFISTGIKWIVEDVISTVPV